MTITYLGMSYEQASREGLRLIENAAKTGNWHEALDKLIELRQIMRMTAGFAVDHSSRQSRVMDSVQEGIAEAKA